MQTTMTRPCLAQPVLRSRVLRSPMRVVAASAPTAVTTVVTSNGNGNGHFQAATTPVPPTPAPVAVSAPVRAVSVLTPPQVYENAINVGAYKAGLTPLATFVQGIQAGAYIAFGAFLAISVGGNIPGVAAANPGLAKLLFALVFPVGLSMVTNCGAELFTGNTMMLTCALIEKKATWGQLLKNWSVSYFGNFVGSIAMVAAVVATGCLTTNTLPVQMATLKANLGFTEVLSRSILCNWLVCCAVWSASAATSLPGRILALWPCITAFVAIGLEHSVANMFVIPLGMMLGAEVTWSQFFFNNLIPVTLGNTIAGVLMMAIAYSISFGSLGKSAKPATA
ncbi:hypothetical protein CHLRE_06g309000v5 [Chlamydomonas reinhardtii]|uniref:Low-CO2 inducible protein LCIA n=1 Tax=Chlamydomonas reinhardtii TaxID=3055 RepID=Q75NZ3_CHLRE|nr:uncharacterized protein CHLRE_06g309000v5 [Chlamydomonas reinhardtii]AAT39454.1 NAR1.2 [Chlamydomonas reinhardtii]PNW83155.1 hypothetical protein CHLRE_06g309000v5 [Chlamydomonas reinhardtii]BAD16681.1 low-CO2 inducible protein LCIA [Chlamydomonas reinhardtii]|eukprot:XP_001691213.1 anion transporter [Chlamydomonas reinhardtii]